MQNKAAADIMLPIEDYVTIEENATLYEAIKALQQAMHSKGGAWHGHRSVLVLGRGGHLVGMLTMRGLLRAAGLKELDNDPQIKAESWGWYYINAMRKETKIRVKDVMRPLALFTVDYQAPVLDVALALLKHGVNSMPVLRQGKPVGIVRTMDVFTVMDDYFY
ncbi:CBS domain-containing protein [Desulfoscipio sp. XC116]|uniref:CBS domain-containing protein n=1 Tax=Desulfoscipio sp. XC116 TaxID=3144975 RepID=UPI00325A8A48